MKRILLIVFFGFYYILLRELLGFEIAVLIALGTIVGDLCLVEKS